MKVVTHLIPDFKEQFVRLLVYSVRKGEQGWWTHYECEYFVVRERFYRKKSQILVSSIERLYEATHDIPDCDCCEERCEDSYSDTRRIMMEDYD